METEIRILAGAEELFSRFGIKNVTMDEIARHLGMSKKTIYLHYIDKNKLVQEVVNRMIQAHDHQCKEFESKSENAINEIFLIMNYMNAFFSQMNPNLFFDQTVDYIELDYCLLPISSKNQTSVAYRLLFLQYIYTIVQYFQPLLIKKKL